MTKKSNLIAVEIKQDISKLVDLALEYAPKKKKDEVRGLHECIIAGLADYELEKENSNE